MSTLKRVEVVKIIKYSKQVTNQDFHDWRLVDIGGNPFYVEHNMVGEEMDFIELYFLSDEEIKEGDWVLDLCEDLGLKYQPFKVDKATLKYANQECKKIIATTDSSLYVSKHFAETEEEKKCYSTPLPQPSQSFIEVFVKEYNKGNVITDVLVEYEEKYIDGFTEDRVRRFYDKPVLKINPKDNTITIKQVKDSWNRQEVENLIFQFANDAGQDESLLHHYGAIFKDAKKWIKENL